MDSRSRNILREARSWVISLVVAVLLALFMQNVVMARATVPSASMENTIMTDTQVLLWRLAYAFSEPQRLDVVVFESPDGEDVTYVKRIIGLPGEVLEIVNGQVFINGADEPIYEWYLLEPPMWWSLTDQVFYIPEGHFFVMGDHRNNSKDSRGLGLGPWENLFIPRENILGRVSFSFWPLNQIGFIR
ncbi:MAG: signal peptidase I [Defluviitaleaceae bacterium]|nr:signal peptidase I [Defluviitaleaceae bacterium]